MVAQNGWMDNSCAESTFVAVKCFISRGSCYKRCAESVG